MKRSIILITLGMTFFAACVKEQSQVAATSVSEDDLAVSSLTVSPLLLPESNDYSSIPQDSLNPLTTEKVALGKLLFHETRLAGNPRQKQGIYTYSCATCHHAEAGFQSGLAQAIGEGGNGFGLMGEARVPSASYIRDSIDVQPFKTPSALNVAYQDVSGWNGSLGAGSVNTGTESLWTIPGTQLNRLGLKGPETISIAAFSKHRLFTDTAWLSSNATYKSLFDAAFPGIPAGQRISDKTIGLAIAAFQRTIVANQSPFQRWLRGDKRALTADENAGRKLFFGKANCRSCHKGPALNSTAFFAVGMNDLKNGVDGVFNAKPNAIENQGRGSFTNRAVDMFKFKVPQLYNLKDARFFGHGSSFHSVEEVVRYFNNGVPQNTKVPTKRLAKQFVPLNLTEEEIHQLVRFVEDALYDPNLSRYVPSSLPSGNCFPNNDAQSRIERGFN